MNEFSPDVQELGQITATIAKKVPQVTFGVRLLEGDDGRWQAEITITATGQYPTTYKMTWQATQLAAWYSATSHLEVRTRTMRPPS